MATLPADEKLKAIVSEAIALHMGDEMRSALIQEAITHLLTPPAPAHYGQKTQSPLQYAFDRAIDDQAREIAKKYVQENTDLHEKIRQMVAEAAKRAVDDPEKMIARITAAISNSLRGE